MKRLFEDVNLDRIDVQADGRVVVFNFSKLYEDTPLSHIKCEIFKEAETDVAGSK